MSELVEWVACCDRHIAHGACEVPLQPLLKTLFAKYVIALSALSVVRGQIETDVAIQMVHQFVWYAPLCNDGV